jgi:predicted transcriptional regulator
MKVKGVKIGLRSVDGMFENFITTAEAIERGEVVKKQPSAVYFSDLDAFRKALTQKRLELIQVIRKEKPSSIHELARLVHRDIKNVSTDVKYLSQVGLVDLKQTKNRLFPSVCYGRIKLDIAV